MEARARIPVGPPVNNPLQSYWHNPKSPLAKVIEPDGDKSIQSYDYAIIGSGITGTMIAHNLLKSQPSARIIMLEARDVCSGATGRNGGHTKAASYRSYLQHVQEMGKEEALKIARLEYKNIIETHRMAKDMKIECESKLCNTLDVIYDRSTFEMGQAAIEALRTDTHEDEKAEGEMAWYQVYNKDEAMQQSFHISATNRTPSVKDDEEVAGVFEYQAGRIHAYRFATAILNTCTQKGLKLCTQTPVHAILPSQEPSHTSTPLWDVFTQFSTITTHAVILATNGYTPYLLSSLQGSIVPMRGQITAQRTSSLPVPLATTYSFIYRTGYEYMIPRPLASSSDGQDIVIGGGLGRLLEAGASEYGTVDDASLNPVISTYLQNTVTGYFGVEECDAVQEWSGIMGATSDGRPFVGEVPGKKGVWMAAGFNGHGMVLCLKVAEALVNMMQSGEWPEWFPKSFVVSEERLGREFGGRTDMKVSEN
jgi:glycine/D-amino acid oxidase-like deaminating enzyme